MIKPIEPGCLAIAIIGPQTGEQCEVICWVDDGDEFATRGGGYKNEAGGSGWAVEFVDGGGVFRPGCLLRIDGDDTGTIEEREDAEVPA